MIPTATYRIQFHAGFPFADAVPLAPYLRRLGISHVYASPITTARAGSTHGYDVVNPSEINPELGGEAGFRALVAALRAEGLGVIVDIVPNHMAVGGADNRWWLDVLENGRNSLYARHFDIDWDACGGKLLAPFLGKPYAQALAEGDLRLVHDAQGFAVIAHGVHRFPVAPIDQPALLADPSWPVRFDPHGEDGRDRLHALIERQHYRLAWWRAAGDAINWRRFFDITELAGLRVEDDAVFDDVHQLAFRLHDEGLIDGVRVDHVDGLADPAGYCRRLRARLGPDAYIVVEKILGSAETLSVDWQVDGTSGYDFMNEVSALLHDPAGEAPLAAFWAELSGRSAAFAPEEHAARLETLARSFAGQLDAAAAAFARLAAGTLETRDLTLPALRRGLVALIASFAVYRTYGEAVSPALSQALAKAKQAAAPGEDVILDQLAAWLAGDGPGDPQARREAVRRFQQLSAPVSAKAVEDTAFYRYGRLLSRTDVGFDPIRFASDPSDFLELVASRAEQFPSAMLGTATHDHKRGEDVRARLAVLSEIPDRWISQARRWLARVADVDPADAYMLFQTLVGAWPLDLRPDDPDGIAAFADRVAGWQVKALREAKLRSSWTAPNESYEARADTFLRELLGDPAFVRELQAIVDAIAAAGAANGLVQAALRCTLPGVPDLYQGCEFWDYSLVDPDNRRPVDYPARIAALDRPADPAGWRDGRIKQRMIADLLALRLSARAEIVPVACEGSRAGHVMAFVSGRGSDAVLVAVALRTADALADRADIAIGREWWGDTRLRLGGGRTVAAADLLAERPWATRAIEDRG